MRRKPEKRPVVFRIKKTGQKEKMTPSFLLPGFLPPWEKRMRLKNRNAFFRSLFINLIGPYRNLDLADMGLSQEKHTDAGLANAAADGLR